MSAFQPPEFKLLQQLLDSGINLQTDARRRLKVNAPEGALTPTFVEELRQHKQGLVQALRLVRCGACDSTIYVDVPIHNGRSTRRDCATCNNTLGFPAWYSKHPIKKEATFATGPR